MHLFSIIEALVFVSFESVAPLERLMVRRVKELSTLVLLAVSS